MGGRRGAAGVVVRGDAPMLCIRAYHLKHRYCCYTTAAPPLNTYPFKSLLKVQFFYEGKLTCLFPCITLHMYAYANSLEDNLPFSCTDYRTLRLL
jgi:hypothetical protein